MAKKKSGVGMGDEAWGKFFELLADIVNAPGSYAEKKAEVILQAAEQGAEASFEEFIGWFDGVIADEDDDDDTKE